MTDINTPEPNPREHPEEPAEGRGDDGAREPRRHSQDPAEGDPETPPDEMSSYDIEPPPTDEAEVPGVPDASDALEDHGPDQPGANATGVGA
jgi:hypothetical protein